MNYPEIILTLHEFDLITTEQAEQALAKYDHERVAVEERAKAFKEEWKKSVPWWKRFWGDWRIEFYKAEMRK